MQIPQSDNTYSELISLIHGLKLAYAHDLHPWKSIKTEQRLLTCSQLTPHNIHLSYMIAGY